MTETLVLIQAGGVWQPIINWMQVIVGAAATLTIVAGGAIWASAPHDEEKVAIGKEMIGAAVVGLLIALLAVPAYKIIDGWLTSAGGNQGSAPPPLVEHAHGVQPTHAAPAVVLALSDTELPATEGK